MSEASEPCVPAVTAVTDDAVRTETAIDAPPAPQWSLDPATLSKMSTEDLETALKHAERVQDLLAGKKPEPTP